GAWCSGGGCRGRCTAGRARLAARDGRRGARLKDVGLDVGVGVAADRAELTRRHGRADLLGEGRVRAPAPMAVEVRSLERRRELRSLEGGSVTRQTGLTIGRLTALGLSGADRRRRIVGE